MAQPRTIPTTPTPWASKFNGTGSDIGASLCVMHDDSKEPDGVKLPAAADSPIVGVTGPSGIKNGEWGDVFVDAGGTVPVKNSGGVSAGERLMPNTDGTVSTFSATGGTNKSYVGIAKLDAATTVIEECMFAGPGQSRQG